MFINYRQYILQLGGVRIQFAAPQDKNFFLGCCSPSLVCGFKVCLSFLQRENREGGGSEIQFVDKMESQHRCQEWKTVSTDKWKKFAALGCDGSGRWLSVLATVLWLTFTRSPAGENPASQDCLLWDFSFSFFLVCFFFFYPWVLENPTAQQVGGTRGITDV